MIVEVKKEEKMETLLKSKKIKADERWYPTSIEIYKSYLKMDYAVKDSYLIKRNIAYNLQYLEYLEKQLKELELSNVLYGMTCKSYVIVGMGIIEGLFTYLLKSKNLWNMNEWESVKVIKSNENELYDKKVKIQTEIFEKVNAYEMRMDLDSMIKKVESKNLLEIEHSSFPALKKLRTLRNRVHLQLGENHSDNDYNNFGFEEKELMGRILYTILTTEEFCVNVKACKNYEFLKINFRDKNK